MDVIDPELFGSRPLIPPDGTEGTASITLTLKDEEEPLELNGCFIHKDENFKRLINDDTYLEKHRKTKFFIYFCCFYKKLENHLVKIEITVHRFSKPDKDKYCKFVYGRDNAFFLHKGCHVFLPACHENLKTNEFENQFLKRYSKTIPCEFYHEIFNGNYKGVTQVQNQLVKFVNITVSSHNMQLVMNDGSFKKLVGGPLLDCNSQVIGYYYKDPEGNRITIYKLVPQGEITLRVGHTLIQVQKTDHVTEPF